MGCLVGALFTACAFNHVYKAKIENLSQPYTIHVTGHNSGMRPLDDFGDDKHPVHTYTKGAAWVISGTLTIHFVESDGSPLINYPTSGYASSTIDYYYTITYLHPTGWDKPAEPARRRSTDENGNVTVYFDIGSDTSHWNR